MNFTRARYLCVVENFSKFHQSIVTSYLSHPDILIWNPIRGFNTSGTIRNLDPEKFKETSSIDPDKNHIKNLYYEVSGTLDQERNFFDAGKIFWSPDD